MCFKNSIKPTFTLLGCEGRNSSAVNLSNVLDSFQLKTREQFFPTLKKTFPVTKDRSMLAQGKTLDVIGTFSR